MPAKVRAASGSAASGIRGAYETLGVEAFYQAHGHEYSNPHNDQIVKAVSLLMASQQFGEQPEGLVRVLDLAAGSGEATLALQDWASRQQQQWQQQKQQQQQGQQQPGEQQERQDGQQQPQQGRQAWRRQASGGTPAPAALLEITACDPYTQQAYQQRTGRDAQSWSFSDIAEGCLAGRSFDLCVCSFALHLCAPSCLFVTLYQLACHCRWLAVLSPHKQPAVREEHGWAAAQAFKVERVHVRLYRSLNWGQPQE